MHLGTKEIVSIIGFLIILVSIPLAFSLAARTNIFSSRASAPKSSLDQNTQINSALLQPTIPPLPITEPREISESSPLSELLKLLETTQSAAKDTTTTQNASTPTPTPTTISLAFGPTLNFRAKIEGRAEERQAAKVFVGIAAGIIATQPKYILTFTVDLPDSGEFKGLSLAGLNYGSTYTAYLKGPSQIDTASTFVMGPTETFLNNNQPLLLLSGDLNEDNAINSSDFTIAKNLYGTTPSSSNWNPRADLNIDDVVNNLDTTYIIKNFGKTGASSTWYSTPPSASGSAQLNIQSPNQSTASGGYWLWVPPTTDN